MNTEIKTVLIVKSSDGKIQDVFIPEKLAGKVAVVVYDAQRGESEEWIAVVGAKTKKTA